VADREEQERTLARLAALSRPTDVELASAPRATGGQQLLAQAELRAGSALAASATAYTAAHGHPLDHPDLVAPGGARWLTRPRVALVAVVALLLLGGAVVTRAISQAPAVLVSAAAAAPGAGTAVPTDESGAGATPPAGAAVASVEGPGQVVVHVVGEVLAPGVVTLATGARVGEAIDAAGGASPVADLAGLNLARVLADGEQVLVPGPGGAGPAAAVPDGGAITVDLNAATLAELDDLPGIGPVLAQRILDWRSEHGRFSTVDELGEVTGIGPSVLGGVRDLVDV